MKLYKLDLINRHGHTMQECYVVASGPNSAKRILRESSPYYKGVKIKVEGMGRVLVEPPTLPSDEDIEKEVEDYIVKNNRMNFINGAKWVIEQIKQ